MCLKAKAAVNQKKKKKQKKKQKKKSMVTHLSTTPRMPDCASCEALTKCSHQTPCIWR